jgi:hypothetical protein
MLPYLLYLAAAIVLLLLLWPKIRTFLPGSWLGTVTTVMGTASDYATDAVTSAAFTTLAGAGWANSDLPFLAKLDECRQMQKAWNVAPVPPPTPTDPVVATLQAQVAMLVQAAASKSTTTIPSASVWVAPPPASTGTGT